jgi:hypothetical protein
MNTVRQIPSDMDIMRQVYENKNPREGTCGPTLVAFLIGKTVKEVIDNWSIPYRGYCSFRELERELNKYNIETQRMGAEVKSDYILPEDVKIAIARIQWKGKYSHWAIAEKNTHFIYLEKALGQVHLFDNTEGWFEPDWTVAKDYMIRGKITSYLTIIEKEYADN